MNLIIWLGRDRLEIILRLMADDGSFWITIDDNEAHYPLKPCAFTAKDDVKSLYWTPHDKRTIGQYLYGGFVCCAYPYQKFHSDTEHILSTVLERQAKRWFRPASGQFNIYYRCGASQG